MDEPNSLIRWTIYAFAGGSSVYWGAVALAAILTLSLHPRYKNVVSPIIKNVLVVISIASIACGSPPVPGWFQALVVLWIVSVFCWRVFRSANVPVQQGAVRNTVATVWRLSPLMFLAGFLFLELPWQRWQDVGPPVHQMLVIGDSVTAGLNDHDITWPRLLAKDSAVDVFDASQPGATLKSARKQNGVLLNRPGLVVLEIGGNDLLEGLSVIEFERHLDELLRDVTQPDRTVIMFELPLPPFCSRYGAAQRRQSLQHGVRLIPKRLFASVLTTHTATVDGIHLSLVGQTLMKYLIRSLLRSSVSAGTGTYERVDPGVGLAK